MTVYILLLLVSAAVADYGPVDVNQTDPLSLSWNQVHWLVREYISEVEELKAEHDAIYNEITGETNYQVKWRRRLVVMSQQVRHNLCSI